MWDQFDWCIQPKRWICWFAQCVSICGIGLHSGQFVVSGEQVDNSIDGEVLLDGISIGSTNNGEIDVGYLETIPSLILFKGNYSGTAFEFVYEFPEDYLDYYVVPFSVSKEELKGFERQGKDYSNTSELHWGHMPLTYKFENECVGRQINLTKLAFKRIGIETSFRVNFEETSKNPDISIHCNESVGGNDDLTLADTVYEVGNVDENLITHADINFYGQGAICLTGYPALEVHEILHAFGFEHNSLTESIMFPYSAETSRKCKTTKIDDEYVSCLNYIYSNGKYEGNCSISNYYIYEDTSEYGCSEGWYEVIGTDYCCPEPNMEIIDGYCVW